MSLQLASIDARDDRRPEFRVALFGLTSQFQHVLEVVTRHARHNPYRFRVADNRAAHSFDIAVVDMTADGGPELALTLQRMLNGRPVVRVGRRSDSSRGRDDVVDKNFAREVLGALNAFVETHLGLPERAAGAAGAVTPVRPRKPRALIVDDSPTVRRQLAAALHQMGMSSESVGSAREALEQLQRSDYDLVFADVVMPGQDGYQLTREIKRTQSLKGVPVIILTSRSSPFDLARGALAGCSSYLVKPVSLQSLRDTVHRQLQRIGPRRADAALLGVT
ncbi:MAG: response regulator [Burkholderiaceae bacterium]